MRQDDQGRLADVRRRRPVGGPGLNGSARGPESIVFEQDAIPDPTRGHPERTAKERSIDHGYAFGSGARFCMGVLNKPRRVAFSGETG